MTNSRADDPQDPAAIERDIRRTQEDMSRTVDKIGDQLSVRNIFNALLDKADDSDVDARMLLDGARRNPMALGLIAAGAIWLVSDKDSKFPSINSRKAKAGDRELDPDTNHREYVSHMSSVELREGEDPAAYQRRRDIARSNFLMVERGHEEEEHSFRERLDSMTDLFREKRRALSETSADAGAATKKQAGIAVEKAQALYDSNPVVGGILAAALGAALGSALPITRKEQDTLADVGETVRDMASEKKEQLTAKLREAKGDALEKATDAIEESGSKDPRAQAQKSVTKPLSQLTQT